MTEYNRGCMPNTDFTYEEFEGLLGSLHLSLLPLRASKRTEDQRDYQTAIAILNGFAQRYRVKSPEGAVKDPKAQTEGGNASGMTNFSTLDMMGSFWRDFGVAVDPETEDGRERNKLGRLILGVYDRYGVAKIEYETISRKQVPVRLTEWNGEKMSRTLADCLRV